MPTAQLTEIRLLQKEKQLQLTFEDGQKFSLSCEYLRAFTPSAEVTRLADGGKKWPLNKAEVNIIAVEPVGNYAVKLIFDDGHNTGLYSFEYLYELGTRQTENWKNYRFYCQSQ